MSAVMFNPKPMKVDAEALRKLEDYARVKGASPETVLAGMIDALNPGEQDISNKHVVHVRTVYRPERSKTTGHVILPAEWDDPEDEVYGGC